MTRATVVRWWPGLLIVCGLGLILLLELLHPTAARGDSVVRTGEIDDDVFALGTSVDVRANVQGDAFLAGGWIEIAADVADNLIAAGGLVDVAGRVAGDLIVAGAALDLAGQVGDNVVAAAGSLEVDAKIQRKLFAAAGRIKVGPLAHVQSDAWLMAGTVEAAGEVEGRTVISAGTVTLRGRFAGDVEVRALSLRLTDGAQIGGDLTHQGPEPPVIDEGVVVRGKVVHEDEPPSEPAGTGPPVLWLAIVAALGLLLDALLPGYVRQSSRRLRFRPLASLGLGAAILVTTPVLVLLLFLTVLASALGLAAIALYGTLLLIGPVIGVFAAVDLVLKRTWMIRRRPGSRRVAFLVGITLLGLAGWLPYVGTPIMWLVSVTGMGAASWQLYQAAAEDWGPRREVDTAAEETAP